ncbi:MAG: hypothetical protein Fur0018_03320 [Anaerolineales bacterium]
MSPDNAHMALFAKIDQVAEALECLRGFGINEDEMSVISGFPISDEMLGRPMTWTNVPKIAMGGFIGAFIISIALNWGTPLLYPIYVGGQPLLPVPPTIILTFEISMLGLMLSTFLGVLWESVFPSYGPKIYTSEVSHGKIGLVFTCVGGEKCKNIHQALAELGAEWVRQMEAKNL